MLLLCLLLIIDDSIHWPHWRGPTANGIAPNALPPLTWDGPSGKNVRWKTELVGRGSATPIIQGNQLFIVSAEKTDRAAKPEDQIEVPKDAGRMTNPPKYFYRFLLTSYDRHTGAMQWRRTVTEALPHEGHHETHSYAGGSPTTDGQKLYVSFGSFGIFAYDFAGNKLWERQLGRLHTRRGWGEAVTPVYHQGKLLINWDQEKNAALYCLDAATGNIVWKADRDEVTTWTTPLVTEHAGITHVVLNGTRAIRSHDFNNGTVLWSCTGMTINAIPSVLRHGDNIICLSGYQGSAAVAIPLNSRGEVKTETLKWKHTTGTPYVPSAVVVENLLYFTGGNANVLTILDATSGRPILQSHRLTGTRQFYASPLFANGRLYFTDRDGTTAILEHGEKGKILSVNKLGDGVDASPVAVGKVLYLRGEKWLWCLEEK
jgi:outer membrane protein assembly factor BamB